MKITNALMAPWAVSIAKQEVAAQLIHAQGDIAVERMKAEGALDLESDLRQRAIERHWAEQIQHQRNIENITRLALPDVRDDAEPEKLEDDWISHFFERCRNVTNTEMQALWARILAGEANSPGSFSKRTIDFLGSLEREEGLQFSNLCNFSVSFAPDNECTPVIIDHHDAPYVGSGLSFATLEHLRNIGLISLTTAIEYKLIERPNPSMTYFRKKIQMESAYDAAGDIPVGKVMFTQIGRELSRICERVEVPGFADYLVSHWVSLDLKLLSIREEPLAAC